ncbi:YkvA family protein [Ferrovibrio xuzhouensis]|uniref:YkvA family protein n=1 Tax=Ferrovibrio xuzhouensis TaxID=1576914 RepID=A0ABV7VA49_9PROT
MAAPLEGMVLHPHIHRVSTDPNPTAYQLPADPTRLAREEPRLQRRFWRKLKKALGHLPLAETFLAAFYAAIDPKTPAGAKAILFGAIGYFIVPIDLIPDMLGAMGYTDDLAVILAAIRAVESSITDVHRDRAKAWLERIRQAD